MTRMVTFEGQKFSPDMYRRVKFVVENMRREGHRLSVTEGWRPLGVESDMYVRDERKTSEGQSTVWFQWGRKVRGETPEAADPRGTWRSPHESGNAVDWDTDNMSRRDAWMELAGLRRTVASETWHAAIVVPPKVDLPWPEDDSEETGTDSDMSERLFRVVDLYGGRIIYSNVNGHRHILSMDEYLAIQKVTGLPLMEVNYADVIKYLTAVNSVAKSANNKTKTVLNGK